MIERSTKNSMVVDLHGHHMKNIKSKTQSPKFPKCVPITGDQAPQGAPGSAGHDGNQTGALGVVVVRVA